MKILTQQQIRELLYSLPLPVRRIYENIGKHGVISQVFGVSPGMYAQFGLKGHNGIDFYLKRGDPIYFVQDGTVVFTWKEGGGYGNAVRTESETYERWGMTFKFEWTYGHYQKLAVKFGDKMKAGDVSGYGDSTGFSTGDHLHLGLRPLYLVNGAWKYEDNGYKGSVDFEHLFNWKNMSTLTEKLEEEKQKEKWLEDFKSKHDTKLLRNIDTGEFSWYYGGIMRTLKRPNRGVLMILSYLHRKGNNPSIPQADWDKISRQEF